MQEQMKVEIVKQLEWKYREFRVVRVVISVKNSRKEMEFSKKMNPRFLFGIDFNIEYWERKYHSGTICKGVFKVEGNNELSGCDREVME